jgi:hypothetical protein
MGSQLIERNLFVKKLSIFAVTLLAIASIGAVPALAKHGADDPKGHHGKHHGKYHK